MEVNRKLIVDTHFLIWDMMGHTSFTKQAESTLRQYKNEVYFCSISYWEVGMLVAKGRLQLLVPIPLFFSDLITKRGYKVLSISPQVGEITSKFTTIINGDPADRIIAATTMAHSAVLMTEDKNLRALPFLDTV